MQDAVAFALTAEYDGTVEQEIDGETHEVPTFQGGLLHVGDGDIDIAAQLEAGGGVIVVHADDQRLRDLLEAYPALKRVAVPTGAKPLSKYDRQSLEDLRLLGSLRGVSGAGSLSKDRLAAALEAQDAASHAGQASAAAAVAENPEIADGLDQLTKKQLLAIADANSEALSNSGATVSDRTPNAEIIAALRDAGVTAPTTEGGDA